MNDQPLRDQLTQVLDWGHAHMRFDEAVQDFPPELRGRRPPGGPHSPWELLEHLRLALWDIVEFTRKGKGHVSPPWPQGYWPSSEAPPHDLAWDESVKAYRKHLREFAELLADPSVDLFAPIANADGQTPLREVLLVIDHNAWHLGQLVMVRRMLGA